MDDPIRGPWRVPQGDYKNAVIDNRGAVVCRVEGRDPRHPETLAEVDAKRALIAAAPDLHDENKRLRALAEPSDEAIHCAAMAHGQVMANAPNGIEHHHHAMRAAIAVLIEEANRADHP